MMAFVDRIRNSLDLSDNVIVYSVDSACSSSLGGLILGVSRAAIVHSSANEARFEAGAVSEIMLVDGNMHSLTHNTALKFRRRGLCCSRSVDHTDNSERSDSLRSFLNSGFRFEPWQCRTIQWLCTQDRFLCMPATIVNPQLLPYIRNMKWLYNTASNGSGALVSVLSQAVTNLLDNRTDRGSFADLIVSDDLDFARQPFKSSTDESELYRSRNSLHEDTTVFRRAAALRGTALIAAIENRNYSVIDGLLNSVDQRPEEGEFKSSQEMPTQSPSCSERSGWYRKQTDKKTYSDYKSCDISSFDFTINMDNFVSELKIASCKRLREAKWRYESFLEACDDIDFVADVPNPGIYTSFNSDVKLPVRVLFDRLEMYLRLCQELIDSCEHSVTVFVGQIISLASLQQSASDVQKAFSLKCCFILRILTLLDITNDLRLHECLNAFLERPLEAVDIFIQLCEIDIELCNALRGYSNHDVVAENISLKVCADSIMTTPHSSNSLKLFDWADNLLSLFGDIKMLGGFKVLLANLKDLGLYYGSSKVSLSTGGCLVTKELRFYTSKSDDETSTESATLSEQWKGRASEIISEVSYHCFVLAFR
jgi:hypothetical protein